MISERSCRLVAWAGPRRSRFLQQPLPFRPGRGPERSAHARLETGAAGAYAAGGNGGGERPGVRGSVGGLWVPAGPFIERADGTAQRESFRRYFSLTVEPLAGLLAAELSAKLEADISLGFSARFAADLAGRARAVQSMVKAAMDLAKAASLAGLMEVEN